MGDCLSISATVDGHVAALICKFAPLRIRCHSDPSPQNTVHQSGDNVQGIFNVTLVNFLEMGLAGSGAAATLEIIKDMANVISD